MVLILHSFDKEHWRLYREARAIWPDLEDRVCSMWAIVNLDYCKTNMGDTYDDSFQNAMYTQVGISHYLWTYENALCLLEEERQYSFLVLVDHYDNLFLARYGAFEPEYEEEQIYCFSDSWLSLENVSAKDTTLGTILSSLFH